MNTYTMKFKCFNCGHKFAMEIPEGKQVKTDFTFGADTYTKIQPDNPGELGERIKCPNCKTTDVGKVIAEQE